MNKLFDLLKNGTLLLTLGLLLAACSSEGEKQTDSGLSGPPAQIKGSAMKGLIKYARVIASELDSEGKIIIKGVNSKGENVTSIGIAAIDENGQYELMLRDTYQGGPIGIIVEWVEETTIMKCDRPNGGCGKRTDGVNDTIGDRAIIDFGDWYHPKELSLTAILPAAQPDEIINLNVSPFTHLAAQRVLATGNVNATSITAANSEVSNLLGGIDILNTRAIDITDEESRLNASPTELVYAALSSALTTIAQAHPVNQQPDITQSLIKLAESFPDGIFTARNAGTENDSSLASMTNLVLAANLTYREIEMVDVSGVMVHLTNAVITATDLNGDGNTNIDPVPSPNAGESNLNKVKALVTDIRTWANLFNTETDQPKAAFQHQIKLASDSTRTVIRLGFHHILKAAIDAGLEFNGNTDLSSYTVTSSFGNFSAGSISSPSPDIIVIKDGIFGDFATINTTLHLPKDGTTLTTLIVGLEDTDITGTYADTNIKSGLVTLNLSAPYTINRDGIAQGSVNWPEISSAEIDLDITLDQKWDFNTNNFATDPINFAGSLKTTLFPIIDRSDPTAPDFLWATPSTLQLIGNIKNTSGDSVDASISANISNAANFDPTNRLSTETPDSWMAGSAGVTFNVQLDGLPKANITITANRTDFEAGDLEITVIYGDRKIVISASGDAIAENVVSDITFTNQDGAILNLASINNDLSVGTLIFNGKTYGTILKTASGYIKINYIDNTFEIL